MYSSVNTQVKPFNSLRRPRGNIGAPIFWGIVNQGGTLIDISNGRRTAAKNSAVTQSVYGGGPALIFPKTVTGNCKVTLSNTSVMSPVPLTVSCWFNLTSQMNNGTIWECINSAASGPNFYNGGWAIQYRSGGLYAVLAGSGYTGTSTLGPVSFSTGVDYRAHMTYDGATLAFYLNGVLKSSAACSGNIPASVGANPGLYVGGDGFFDAVGGRIDDCRVYNYAMTASQVMEDKLDPWAMVRERLVFANIVSAPTAAANSNFLAFM